MAEQQKWWEELPMIIGKKNQNGKKGFGREQNADGTFVTVDFLTHIGCINEILKVS